MYDFFGKNNWVDQEEFLAKVIFIGERGVGKTSIMHKRASNQFKTDMKETINIDFRLSMQSLSATERMRLQLWDVAGDKRRATQDLKEYSKNAKAIVFVFDCKREETYPNHMLDNDKTVLQEWLENTELDLSQLPIFIAANKVYETLEEQKDLLSKANAGNATYQYFDNSGEHNFPIINTDAKWGENTDELFETIARTIKTLWDNKPPVTQNPNVEDSSSEDSSSEESFSEEYTPGDNSATFRLS